MIDGFHCWGTYTRNEFEVREGYRKCLMQLAFLKKAQTVKLKASVSKYDIKLLELKELIISSI